MKQKVTFGEVQEPPSVGLRTVLCITLTTYKVLVFVGSGLAFFIAAFLGHGPDSQAASSPTKMVIAYAAMNARVAPLWAAEDHGFFAKYGISPEVIFVRGAPILVAAMTAGDIQVGYTGGTAVVGAAVGGADLKILANFTSRVTYDLVARPEIKRVEDLRGKRFGVQSIGGTVWMGAILGLENLGLDPNRDNINILVIGDQSVLAQALLAGTIDATVLDGVHKRLFRRGLRLAQGRPKRDTRTLCLAWSENRFHPWRASETSSVS